MTDAGFESQVSSRPQLLAEIAERVALLHEFRTDDFQDIVVRLVQSARERWRDDQGELPPPGYDPLYDALVGIADEHSSLVATIAPAALANLIARSSGHPASRPWQRAPPKASPAPSPQTTSTGSGSTCARSAAVALADTTAAARAAAPADTAKPEPAPPPEHAAAAPPPLPPHASLHRPARTSSGLPRDLPGYRRGPWMADLGGTSLTRQLRK